MYNVLAIELFIAEAWAAGLGPMQIVNTVVELYPDLAPNEFREICCRALCEREHYVH